MIGPESEVVDCAKIYSFLHEDNIFKRITARVSKHVDSKVNPGEIWRSKQQKNDYVLYTLFELLINFIYSPSISYKLLNFPSNQNIIYKYYNIN